MTPCVAAATEEREGTEGIEHASDEKGRLMVAVLSCRFAHWDLNILLFLGGVSAILEALRRTPRESEEAYPVGGEEPGRGRRVTIRVWVSLCPEGGSARFLALLPLCSRFAQTDWFQMSHWEMGEGVG